jgi:hypothetical protein
MQLQCSADALRRSSCSRSRARSHADVSVPPLPAEHGCRRIPLLPGLTRSHSALLAGGILACIAWAMGPLRSLPSRIALRTRLRTWTVSLNWVCERSRFVSTRPAQLPRRPSSSRRALCPSGARDQARHSRSQLAVDHRRVGALAKHPHSNTRPRTGEL